MTSAIAYANFTQFKFCESVEDAQRYVELFGDGQVFVPMAEVERLREKVRQLQSVWSENACWVYGAPCGMCEACKRFQDACEENTAE